VREFHIELSRLKATTAKAGLTTEKSLDQLKQKIARIVSAIAEGTDTPSLRDALVRLEAEKITVQKVLRGPKSSVSVEPGLDLQALFRKKIAGLEKTLSSDPTVTNQAASIFRTLIDRIVLRPGLRRGIMSIEVHGEPSTLFLMARAEKAGTDEGMIKVVAEEGFEPPTRGL
jgi:site-specific DNA recombinase